MKTIFFCFLGFVGFSGIASAERSYCLSHPLGSTTGAYFYAAQVAYDTTQTDSCQQVIIQCDYAVSAPWPNQDASCSGGDSCIPFTESTYTCTTIANIN